jgi:hypothetical protein
MCDGMALCRTLAGNALVVDTAGFMRVLAGRWLPVANRCVRRRHGINRDCD